MILREISDASIVISLVRYFNRLYSQLEQKLTYLYYNSQIYSFTKGFKEKIKICFIYSYFGKIINEKQISLKILYSSRVVQYFMNFYKKWKNMITQFLKTSLMVGLAKDTKRQLIFSPVKIISMIVIIAFAVNVFLILVLQKQIGLWGWLIRGLLLFVAISGLFSKADWPTVKRSSVFLGKMRMD